MADRMEVANTIRGQIGRRALFMMGAREFVATEVDGNPALRFRIGRNVKGLTHVFVVLDPSDTYALEFRSIRASRKALEGFTNKLKDQTDGVYAEDLPEVIGCHTGLAVSL